MAHVLRAHYDQVWQKHPGVSAYLKAIYPAIQQLRLGPESVGWPNGRDFLATGLPTRGDPL